MLLSCPRRFLLNASTYSRLRICCSFFSSSVSPSAFDFRGEVATGTLIEKAWELGKKVYVPRVAGKEMEFYQIYSFEDLEKGAYGILEPKKECPVYEAGEGQTTLAILPGSVFDEKKNRVGYGGGFYDRYFEKRKDICRIAAAYEMQIVEEIETEEFDLPADYVTTEERFW